ncbi:MAG: 2-phosphosulfolactate phosphatase [Candidatus Palauibacterales bacterium]|nr:2-phosphosulfolactate phosphatase [Candidatus Palauibacterales bacterium]MDP2530285.1 2-phosphosulfolactate phosphatase [Candidatus Palauibacterales bacterium]MDP2583070.1 2-phosphosulfolactate phosphatase [Candidatus Palauibacterales bacterium]
MNVRTRLAPGELGETEPQGRVAVVIDVIRASTTIVAALDAGARRLVPVDSTEAAERRSASYDDVRPLLCGEREGLPIRGFDLGNSPREFVAESVGDRDLVITTTNGTRALERVRGAQAVLVACLRNLGAVADELRRRGRPVLVVCAGRGGRVGLDDVWCAGLLVERLGASGPVQPDDGARVAMQTARGLGEPNAGALARTEAGAALVRIGLGGDLDMCASVDSSRMVPMLTGEGLVPAGLRP